MGERTLHSRTKRHQGQRCNGHKPPHPHRAEPVRLLALVEDHLEGREPDGQKAKPDIVDSRIALAPDIGRILDKVVNHQQRQNADRQVDIEDPAPRIVVGNHPPISGPSSGDTMMPMP